MSQVQVTKLNNLVAVGSASNEVSATKLNVLLTLIPADGDDGAYRAAQVQTRIIRRS